MIEVRNPYSQELVQAVPEAGLPELDAAIERARAAFAEMRRLPAHRRSAILAGVSARLDAERERFARLITAECGKPIREARGEVIPMDIAPAGEGRVALTRRFPLGVIGAITPFNFPLNLVLHKVTPALAAGNTVVLKPSPRTPLTALALAELFAQAGLPDGALVVVSGGADVGQAMARDGRLKLLTFTGSAAVGWGLKAAAGKKKVTLELGGNCGAVVHADADLKHAAQRIAVGGFTFAGQSCVSVQRVFVHAGACEKLLSLLLPMVSGLRVGDPADEATDVGPMIDLAAAERAEAWVREAVEGGAKVLAGGRREGSLFWPTVLTRTAPAMKVNCQEVFAPVVTVSTYENFGEALRAVNDSPYGLHAGVFTRDVKLSFQAFEELEVGGVVVNDVPTYRVDHMPYGGMKDSGTGREGLRYAIEEMTETKILILNLG